MDRRGQQAGAGGARRLEMLRQKRNMLRTRSEEVKAGGSTHPHSHGSSLLGGAGKQLSDAAILAAAAQRRRASAYALSSSSSSENSDAEEGGSSGTPSGAAPTEKDLTAKLFAKLGIKQFGQGSGHSGFDSDSSWASSPEQRGRLIQAVPAPGAAVSAASSAGAASEQLQAELSRARSTIAALQQEVAAARTQADGTTQQLHVAQEYAQRLEAQLAITERELEALRGGAARVGVSMPAAQAVAEGWEGAQTAEGWEGAASPGPSAAGAAPSTVPNLAWASASGQDAQALAAANQELEQQLEQMSAQLAVAAAWQQEVQGMRGQLVGMQAAVEEAQAARQDAEAELRELLQQREAELMQATARLAAAEAQLEALGSCAGSNCGARGSALAGVQLRPAAELLAQFTVSHAQISAALAEATALLA